MKEARAFRENAHAWKESRPVYGAIKTVQDGLQKWLDICEKEGRGGRDPVTHYTLKGYRYRAEIIASYDWPDFLPNLRAPDVVEFRSWLLRNYSRDQARKVLSYFHSMVIEMVNRGVLDHNIASGVRVATTSRYDKPIRIPTVEEVRALLSAADRLANSKNAQIARSWARYRPMLYLAADSGMRPQEYVVLPRFNLSDRGVMVDRALDAGGAKISVTKTPAGRRFIDLSPETLDMVRHYGEKIAWPNDHDLVFPTSTGKWQSTKNWRRRGFQVACLEAGLIDSDADASDGSEDRPKFKPYDLRHFYASMLIDRKVNLKRIQKLMGHADIQTTLNVYGHIIDKDEDIDNNIGIISILHEN
ncbi:tyrosine-type recombinase/integrase [Roseospirillum parvum]|nr:site-specific integrase [Roseospirillum parvum]